MAKLVITDPETGERVGTLVIPAGATHEQIVEAGTAVLQRWKDKRAAAAAGGNGDQTTDGPAPSQDERKVLCQMCRQPIDESVLAAHVEVEQQRMIRLELQAEAQRGRR